MFEPDSESFQSPEVRYDEYGRVYIVENDGDAFLSVEEVAEEINKTNMGDVLRKTTPRENIIPKGQEILDKYITEENATTEDKKEPISYYEDDDREHEDIWERGDKTPERYF